MKDRLFWLDAVKFLAILFVILAHVEWGLEQSLSVHQELSRCFLTINRIIASLGVPLFMMVSGSLLLSKEFHSRYDILTFYQRRLLPLFVTAEIWIVCYCLVAFKSFSLKELFLCMVLVHKPEVHLWYVRLIVIYYLSVPFLYFLMHNHKKVFAFIVLMVLAFTFIYNGWLIWNGDLCPTNPARSYFCYLIYMVIGYELGRVSLSLYKHVCFCLLAIIGGGLLYLSLVREDYFLWYDHPLIALVAIGVFYVIRYLSSSLKVSESIVEISKMSYGIYLSHFILIYMAVDFMQCFVCDSVVFYLMLIGVFVIDIIVISMVKRYIPKFSNLFFRY